MQLPDEPAVFATHCQVACEAYENVSGEMGPEDQGGGLGIAG